MSAVDSASFEKVRQGTFCKNLEVSERFFIDEQSQSNANQHSKSYFKSKPTLEEECLELKKNLAKLFFRRIEGNKIVGVEELKITNPMEIVAPGDYLFRGNAAREFANRVLNGEDSEKVLEEITKKYPNDVLKVTPTNSQEIVEFLAEIEKAKLLNMIDYKIKYDSLKLEHQFSKDPNVDKEIRDYKLKKLEILENFKLSIINAKNYNELRDASIKYLDDRRKMRSLELKSWNSKELVNKPEMQQRMSNWKENNKLELTM